MKGSYWRSVARSTDKRNDEKDRANNHENNSNWEQTARTTDFAKSGREGVRMCAGTHGETEEAANEKHQRDNAN